MSDDRLIVALDVPNALAGLNLAERLGDAVSFYKIGLGMLTGGGLALANELKQDHGKRIFLDMKLFDIGATVENAVRGLAQFDLDFLTVHGDPHVVRAAREGARIYRRERDLTGALPGATGPRRGADIVSRLLGIEAQIEADRRAIDEQLVRLRRQLQKVVKTRTLHRAARAKVPYPIVALVGYTNAGKSTLFNRLTGAEVMAKDMLFATLDPTMRRVVLPDGPEVILSDTVGFISDLPTELVAAFRATLEEVLAADLILHVRDISHDETVEQAEDVDTILASLGVDDSRPKFEVWNKIDQLDPEAREAAATKAARDDTIFAISALTGDGVDPLLDAIAVALRGQVQETLLQLAFSDGRKRAWLFEQDVVQSEEQTDAGFDITVRWTAKQAAQFEAL